MAKIFELVSPRYYNLRVVPTGSARSAGEFDTYGNVNGFYLTDVTADDITAGKSFSLITKAEKVKVAKTTGQAWVPGEPIYYDPATEKLTNISADPDPLVGYVQEPAETNDTDGVITFDGFANYLSEVNT